MTTTKPKHKPKGIFGRLLERLIPPESPIAEMIGRASYQLYNQFYKIRPSIDYTQTDYEYFDKLRNGKLAGFEIGGLFAKPMAEIISSWALGDGFAIEQEGESEDTETAIKDFLQEYLQALVETSEDKLTLGDAYLIVNPDGKVQKLSPEQVEVERDELDFNLITAITVCTNNEAITIKDRYTATERTVTIKRANEAEQSQSFPNLIGRIPIVPFYNDRSPNEAYGHPYFESLLTLFAEYDDVMRKGLDGVKLMGNPTPVVTGLKDADSAKRTNATYTDTYVDNQGNTQTDYRMEMDRVEMLFFGEGAAFQYAAPGKFTDNTTDMLKKLFYVMLQHAKIPEWVWGGAISSSMASVQAQAPAFVKFIEGQRRKLESPIRDLLEIYLATISLFTPNISLEAFTIEWPELMPVDKELMLKWAMWLKEQGIITDETALRLADVVKDISAELEQAKAQAKEAEASAIRMQQKMQAQALIQQSKAPQNGASNGARQPVMNGATNGTAPPNTS